MCPTDCAAISRAWSDMGGKQNGPSDFGVNCCNYGGITCANNSNLITSVGFGSLGLAGFFSPTLGTLLQLTSLDLSQNSLHGTIPASMGLLQLNLL